MAKNCDLFPVKMSPTCESLPHGLQPTRSIAAPAHALASAEDAAKQLVALTGTLQGLYFAVFAFSDLRARVANPLLQLLFLAPLALWLASLFCATRVFIPQPRHGADLADDRVNAWQKVRETYFEAGSDKRSWLQRAHVLLVISFVAVLVLIIALVFVPAAPGASPT